jgi:hypothetical protein
VDQVRVERTEHVLPEAEPREPAHLVVLHEDVAASHEPPEDLAAGVRLTALAGTLPGADARLDVARLRISAAGEQPAEARALAGQIDTAHLDALWHLLALESRVALAENQADAASIAREAEAIPPARILALQVAYRANARARRGALMLFGGRGDAIAAADRDDATELAASLGWTAKAVQPVGEVP